MNNFIFNKKYTTGVILLAGSVLLNACNSGGSTEQGSTSNLTAKNQKLKDSIDDFYPMQLGSPIETSNKSVTSSQSCLAAAANQNNIVIANPSAVLSFSSSSDFSLLQSALGVDVSSQIGGGRWSASVASQFATASKDSAYTMNIIYLYKYSGIAQFKNGTLGQGDAALTTEALNSRNISPYNFRQQCGNDYIAQMDAGMVLAVNIQLSFNSSYDATRFKLNTSFNTPLGSVVSQIQSAAKSQNISTSMSLSALQLGGQPQYLPNVFGSESATSGNYPLIDCGSANISSDSRQDICAKAISNIVAYSQSMESQVTTSDGKLNFDNLYYSRPVIQSYMSLGITEQAPDPGESQLQAMQWLTSTYDTITEERDLLNHYLNRIPQSIPPNAKTSVNSASRKLNNQINQVFKDAPYDLMNCFKGYVSTQCTDIEAQIQQALNDPSRALNTDETDIVNNYMTGSYLLGLYNFMPNSGVTTPTAENQGTFQLEDSNCVLAPISFQSSNQYILQCDGQIQKTINSKPVMVTQNFVTGAFAISNLNYFASSVPAASGLITPPISYGDISLISIQGGYMSSGVTIHVGAESSPINDVVVIASPQQDQQDNGI